MPKPTSHRKYVAGKGSWPRECFIPREEFEANWDAIFGAKSLLNELKTEALRCAIARHRDLYYNGRPEISDAEYDRLVAELAGRKRP